jgi:hypothetical protein
VWQPLFWNLAEQSPQELVASDNPWLQLMAVLRVEDADAATFRDIFTQAVHQVKKIKGNADRQDLHGKSCLSAFPAPVPVFGRSAGQCRPGAGVGKQERKGRFRFIPPSI